MSHPGMKPSIPIRFYVTTAYSCSYLSEQQASSLVAAPAELIDARVYGQLLQLGFRRGGEFVYRPACESCSACVPVRLQVNEFMADRSQRRAVRRHSRLKVSCLELDFVEEHFLLYQRYQALRHPGGGMDLDDREQYENFILKSRVSSFLAEFREEGVLRMVSLIDQVDDGLSSAYTFYDAEDSGASYGVYNIVWQVGLAKQLHLPYLYLGYWIGACGKMAYKMRYRPLEGRVDGAWRLLDPDAMPI